MFTYSTKADGSVILEMDRDDWERLLLMLGQVAGTAHRAGDVEQFYEWIKLANDLNRTNPRFTPYEIPATEKKGSV